MRKPVKGERASKEFWEWFHQKIDVIMPMTTRVMNMIDDGEQLVPVLFVFSTDNRLALVPVPMHDGHKEEVFRIIKLTADHPEVEAVVLAVESPYAKGKSIADHPDRKEAMVYTAIKGNQQLIANCLIDRKTRSLEKPFIIDPVDPKTRAEGRMVVNEPSNDA